MTMVSSRRANCPMPTNGEAATKNSSPLGDLQWTVPKQTDDYLLEGKSGASSRGNSSSNSVY